MWVCEFVGVCGFVGLHILLHPVRDLYCKFGLLVNTRKAPSDTADRNWTVSIRQTRFYPPILYARIEAGNVAVIANVFYSRLLYNKIRQ